MAYLYIGTLDSPLMLHLGTILNDEITDKTTQK